MKKSLSDISVEFLKGPVSEAMEDYEPRPSQIKMTRACAKTIEEGGVLMAEAGTGTGKTFAYLIPAILSGKKTIVSTRTINLQGQLVSKDLGFLSTLRDVHYSIAKGRGNYLCLRRLNAYRSTGGEEPGEYRRLLSWASETETGDREDDSRRSPLWEMVHSDGDACGGKKCPYFGRCFYFRARQRWEKAQIVVANHALIGINAMLQEESRILPDADVLVIDEAHALDKALSDLIGVTISKRGFDATMNRLLRVGDRGVYKGLLSNSPALFSSVESLRQEMEIFWTRVRGDCRNRQRIRGAFSLADLAANLGRSIGALIEEIKSSAIGLFTEDEELEAASSSAKLRAFAAALEVFPDEREDFVRWAEIEENSTALRMSPVYPGDFVSGSIINSYGSVILTSATLSVSGDFGFFEKVLGLRGSEKMIAPSPFDIKNRVEIEIRKGINLLNGKDAGTLAEVIVDEAEKRDGGILVLFTSREVMKKIWELTYETLADMGLNPMLQGELPNRTMLEAMRARDDAVIFGLDSFWEGVDVKGDSLKSLIITKLPFEVPTEPLVSARTEEIERSGGNPFYDYSLPRAVIKFKQGFGRLIRSKTDTGRIVICDERIETKAYGRKFLEDLL